MVIKKLLFLLCVSWMCCNNISSTASASQVMGMSFSRQVKLCPLIIHALVISSQTAKNPKGRYLHTIHRLKVLHFLKGKLVSRYLTVHTEGGVLLKSSTQKEYLRQHVIGAAKLRSMREAILFLDVPTHKKGAPSPTHYIVMNMGLGHYPILHIGKQKYVHRQQERPAQWFRRHGKLQLREEHFTPAPLRLSSFVQKIRDITHEKRPPLKKSSSQASSPVRKTR